MFDFAITRTYVHPARSNSAEQGKIDAEFYNGMEFSRWDADVISSYDAFAHVLIGQWNALVASGFRFIASTDDPYANSAEMITDARNGSLRVYADKGVTLPPLHYMTTPPVVFGGVYVEGFETLNDVFRGVHDILGHAAGGHSFGPKGEHAAWVQHRATMPVEALSALYCETRGQNAWTNFYADHASLPITARPYAEQKMGTVHASLR